MKKITCGKCGCDLYHEHFNTNEETNLVVDADDNGKITNIGFWCASCFSGEGLGQ
tara:strand:+ start:846 stop:1010 length:165 start_codon:yes stop_codon:yes gene_type:complete